MAYDMFSRKRESDSSSGGPPNKVASRNVASHSSWLHENTSRRANYRAQEDRGSTRDDFERRASSSEARMNPFLRSPPRKPDDELEPPGTGSSTLQCTLTPRVSFLTWKDRLYRELEELSCLFTIEPTLRKKANMTLEDELSYRNLAKAIICMRLDDAHLPLVSNLEDPLMVMKVLTDFREPDLRHLEERSQQRLNSTVYHAAVPVRDFIRTFENQLKEVEKYSGERMSDNTMKQHLLSAVIGELPDVMVASKVSSGEIRYEDLKKLVIEAVERRAAGAKVASRNVQPKEKPAAGKKIEVLVGRAGAARTANAASSQGLESRIGTSKIVEVNDRRPISSPIGSNANSRNAEKKEQHSTSSNTANTNAAVKVPSATAQNQRPAVKKTEQVAGKNAEETERHSVGATVAGQNSVENERRLVTSSAAVDVRPHTNKEAKATERRFGAKSVQDETPLPAGNVPANANADERPFSARNAKPNERHYGANYEKDERPFSGRDAKPIERRPVAKAAVDERPIADRSVAPYERRAAARSAADEWPSLDARPNDRHSGPNAAGRNTDAENPRPIGAAMRNAGANQRQLAISDAVGRNADEWYPAAGTGAANVGNSNSAGKSGALYERRAPRPSAPPPKDELQEQLILDERIQEMINANKRSASKEASCTKCGAYGHVVADCKRKDARRKCYSCLDFVDDHIASTCPFWDECAAMPGTVPPVKSGGKFTPEFRGSTSTSLKPPPSPPLFGHSRFHADRRPISTPPEALEYDEDDDDEDDLPLVDGLRQVYHIRRKFTTKKLKTGRVARKDLIFTDSDFYTDVEYREMFIEEAEEEPGDIILETIKVMSTGQK